MNSIAKAIWIFSSTIILSACTQFSKQDPIRILEEISVDTISTVVVDIPKGKVVILNGSDSRVKIVGSSSYPGELMINQEKGVLEISFEGGNVKDTLTIFLPAGFSFELSTFTSRVEVQGSYDEIDIRSTAGDIWLHDFEGDGIIWAGRGEIQISGGEGNLVVISEHGDQSVEAFSGIVSMTSIMGNLYYSGIETDENEIVLEVDHGSVRVDLPSSVGQQVNITSTSGTVTCVGPGLAQTITGCEGVLGTGVGFLEVRTVSGNVDLWVSNPFEIEK